MIEAFIFAQICIMSNKIVNLTRKTLKDQLFNAKIEECISSE